MKKFFVVLIISLLALPAYAATINVASPYGPTQAQAAINSASAGDTVVMPAGSFSWTATVTITNSITFQGAGKNSTIITNTNQISPLIQISPSADHDVRVTAIGFVTSTNNGGGSFIYVGCNYCALRTKIRIDNCKFTKGTRAIGVHGWTYGVIDHNEFVNPYISIGFDHGGQDSTGTAAAYKAWDGSSNAPIAPGTAMAMFIEDNQFTHSGTNERTNDEGIVYHQEAGRSVIRYNTVTATATSDDTQFIDSHGNWHNGAATEYGARGQPIIEIYRNTSTVASSYRGFYLRGGSLLVHNNTLVTSSGSQSINLAEEEVWTSGGPFGAPPAWDATWPTADQIFNSFFWSNTENGSPINPQMNGSEDGNVIAENRDYWTHAPQSSGGKETLGTGNLTKTMTFSASGANAYYPYTEYTYPHPLTLDGGVDSPMTVSAGADRNTNTASETVTGTASDADGVASVAWSNSRGGSGSCTGDVSWSCGSITMYNGLNTITVTATDDFGRTGSDSIVLTYYEVISNNSTVATTGPQLVYFKASSSGNFKITGSVSAADTGENSFWIDVDTDPSGNTDKTWHLNLTTGYENQDAKWVTQDPIIWVLSGANQILYIREREVGTLIQSVKFVTTDVPNPDSTAPSVTILTSSPQSISTDALTVTGIATDAVWGAGSVCKFRVGAEPDAGNGTACTGTLSWSCATTGFAEGSNTLYIECGDAVPNWSTGNSITVVRAPQLPAATMRGTSFVGGKMK